MQNIQGAEFSDRLLDKHLNLVSPGDVRFYRYRLTAAGRNPPLRFPAGFFLEVSDHHPGPFPGEELRGSSADAGAGPGDNRDLAFQSHLVVSSIQLRYSGLPATMGRAIISGTW